LIQSTRIPSKDPLRLSTWEEFREELIAKFERGSVREDPLRQKLRSIRFTGIRNMEDFCTKFPSLEMQLLNMAFPDRLYIFTEYLPRELHMHIRDSKVATMEDVYSSAKEWVAHRNIDVSSNFGNANTKPKSNKPSFKPKGKSPNKDEVSEDELDVMDAKQLATITCYNYNKKGHLARDYPSPRKPPGKGKKPINYKTRAKSLYRTEETDDSDESQDPEESDESEESVDDTLQCTKLLTKPTKPKLAL
jgi:hypothetical protein